MNKEINIEGRYNSTYGFVQQNNLEVEAEQCFGKGWEAESDCEQIDALINFIGKDNYTVSLIEGVEEDDILVSFDETLAELERVKEELAKYKAGFDEVMCYFDSISDEEQPKLVERLEKIGLL